MNQTDKNKNGTCLLE